MGGNLATGNYRENTRGSLRGRALLESCKLRRMFGLEDRWGISLDPTLWTAVATPLFGLLAAVIRVVGGYFVGVRTSRNERRDAALAEIF